MKLTPLFAVVSVVANVVLLGVLIRHATSEPAIAPWPVGSRPTGAVTGGTGPSFSERDWAAMDAPDLPGQAERLQAAGFPPSVVRSIIRAQVSARFASRRQAITAGLADRPYWDQSSVDPQQQAALRALSLEEQRELRDILGPDPESGHAPRLRRLLPEWSTDKIELVAQIRERHDEKRFNVSNQGSVDDQIRRSEALEKELTAELAAVLSPSELLDYELRESRTASQLRSSLTFFEATEEEYRMLFQLRRAFEQQYGQPTPGGDQALMRAWSDAQRKLNDDIVAALGPERGAAYQRAQDVTYRRTLQLVTRLNLPPATADQIYALQQATQQRATEVRRTAPAAERTAQLAALAAEAETQLATHLGPDGFAAYKEHVGPTWLTNLVPRPAPSR